MFNGVLNAPLNVIVSNIIKITANKDLNLIKIAANKDLNKDCSRSYPEKLRFAQRKIPDVLRNENKDITVFFQPFFRFSPIALCLINTTCQDHI